MYSRIFRAPSHQLLHLGNIVVGSICILIATTQPWAPKLLFVYLGVLFVCGGIAEWLPHSQHLLSGGLRLAAIGAALATIVYGMRLFLR